MSDRSIRSRLSRVLVGVALVWGLIVSMVVWLAVRHEVEELLDDTLKASAEVLVQLIGADLEHVEANPPPALTNGQDERFAWQLVGPAGTVLQRSARAPRTPWMPLATVGFADAADQWRVYGMRLARADRVLYVAQTREERREAQGEVAFSSVCAALVIALASAWWLRRRVRDELQPLTALAGALAQYEPLQPGVRLEPAAREELKPIHDAIESLGQRLARRVSDERAFSAHAAHALRTPLAGIDAQLAMALRECAPEQRERLARVRQAAGRLTRVVSALLALFRSGVEVQWHHFDLAALLERLPPLDGVELVVRAAKPLSADPDLLTAALLNLLDNAVSHGAKRIEVDVDPMAGGGASVVIADDGRGADEERRRSLAAALAEQHYEGRTGLGLMLADMVARAHGGGIELPVVERGFQVRLRLGPAPAPTPAPAPKDRGDPR